MKWMLDLHFKKPERLIHHSEAMMLIGSCFTENIGTALSKLYFNVCANPTGVLFDPDSICRHFERALAGDVVEDNELVFYNERYQSVDFHSDFSDTDKNCALDKMNAALQQIRDFLSHTRHIVITLGSAFAYRLNSDQKLVANCHQFPANDFEKELLSSEYVVQRFSKLIDQIKGLNPSVQFIFTVSPVRHIRDGVVENNRSKARLLESVHRLEEIHSEVYYFPSYEWVIDVLRDYRWYDLDLVHPNYAATDSVFEQFCAHCLDPWTRMQLSTLQQLRNASEHRPRFPDTEAHRKFLINMELKKESIQSEMPWIQW